MYATSQVSSTKVSNIINNNKQKINSAHTCKLVAGTFESASIKAQ